MEIGGHIDNSIKLVSSDGGKTLETAYGHCAPVTCLSVSQDSNFLVTGSRDTTLLLWRIHKLSTARSSGVSENAMGTGMSTSGSGSNLSTTLADKSRKHRIEGPIHVLRGHHREIVCCCVNSDLGIVVSCSHLSDVLIHSIRRGRLIRRLVGVEAHAVRVSSEGVILTWNESQHTLSTFTLNGNLIARTPLSFSIGIGCMEISVDGQTALIGINSLRETNKTRNNSWDFKSKKPVNEDCDLTPDEIQEDDRLDVPVPSVCFLDLHTLKVLYQLVALPNFFPS